ncbi:unnamed protein product, partial [Polarella glacialis]
MRALLTMLPGSSGSPSKGSSGRPESAVCSVTAGRPESAVRSVASGHASPGASPRWNNQDLYRFRWNSSGPGLLPSGTAGEGLPSERLPPLGRPLQGCCSSPLLGRAPTRGSSRGDLQSPGMDTAPLSGDSPPRASTAVPEARTKLGQRDRAWTSLPTTHEASRALVPARARLLSKSSSALKPRVKNSAVWLRWQVHSSSNRLQSEEVLERDRQRQKAYANEMCGGHGRSAASPARSHAAQLFFGYSHGDEARGCLPPGALQHVARPNTRSMHLMPNSATQSFSSTAHPKADRKVVSISSLAKHETPSGPGLSGTSPGGPGSRPVSQSGTRDASPPVESNKQALSGRRLSRSDRRPSTWTMDRPISEAPSHDARRRGSTGAGAKGGGGAPSAPAGGGPGSRSGVGRAKHSVIFKAVEDLPDINILLEPNELAKLVRVMDSYVGLVTPPDFRVPNLEEKLKATRGSSFTFAPPMWALSTTMQSDAGATGGVIAGAADAGPLKDKDGPTVLRPIFCRFLLASKICGGKDSKLSYHECVAAFDEHATRYEAFSGMPRNMLLRVLAGIIMPPDKEEILSSNILFDKIHKVPELVDFFAKKLTAAQAHYAVRRVRLDDRILQIPPVSDEGQPKRSSSLERSRMQKTPESPTHGEATSTADLGLSLGSKAPVVWPPLPPRYVSERDLPAWTMGIRQWEEELSQQSASQLRSLYAHTATVVRGECLSSQLLEPEVLHFATRFRPLFTRLFTEYADERSKEPTIAKAVAVQISLKACDCDSMSFAAFFRFCADFELFPRHASFEEIKQIYDDAEATYEKPQSDCQEVRKKISAQASAAAAAALPKVDYGVFDKPVSSMESLELQIVFFFAAVDEWLCSRFMRLADVVASRMPEALVEIEEPPPAKGRRQSSSSMKSELKSATRMSEMPSLQERRPSGGQAKVPEKTSDGKRQTKAQVEAEEAAAKAKAAEEAAAKAKAEREARPPVVQVAPSLGLSARMFLELAAPPGPAVISEAELDRAFRLLLSGKVPGEAPQGPLLTEISVYQLDKALLKARQACERYRLTCCSIFRSEQEQSATEKTCCRFLEGLDQQLLDRARWDDVQGLDGKAGEAAGFNPVDVFDGSNQEVTAQILLDKAESLGYCPELQPTPEELAELMVQVGGRADGTGAMSKQLVYRLLVIAEERRQSQRNTVLRGRMMLVARREKKVQGGAAAVAARAEAVAKEKRVFGCSAFVECLLKLVLHRLGSKGLSEIQRGAPAWWKCTWLLTLLGGRFNERVRLHRHEQSLLTLSGDKAVSEGTSTDLDTWWLRVYRQPLPRFKSPLE